MYVGPGSLEKKRNEKIAGKLQEQMEKESVKSGDSKISRSKYSVGDRSSSGAIIKEVIELEWSCSGKNMQRISIYTCLLCDKQGVRSDHRRTHACIKK